MSLSSRAKMGESAKLRASDPVWRANHSTAMSGRKRSTTYSARKSISSSLTGRKCSDSHRMAMSEGCALRVFCEIWVIHNSVPYCTLSGHMVSENYPYLKDNGQGDHLLKKCINEVERLKGPGTVETKIVYRSSRDNFREYWYMIHEKTSLFRRLLYKDVLEKYSCLGQNYGNYPTINC